MIICYGLMVTKLCGISSKTVEKYIDLLEKTFVIFKLNSFNRNLRNELKNSKKYIFTIME